MSNIVGFPGRRKIETEAAEWLILLDRDTPLTLAERWQLQAWFNRNPTHISALNELVVLWGQLNILTKLAVGLGTFEQSSPFSLFGYFRRFLHKRFMLAAVLMMLVTTIVLFLPGSDAYNDGSNGFYATAVGHQR